MTKQLFPEAVGARRPLLFFGDRRLALWALAAIGSAFAAMCLLYMVGCLWANRRFR